MSATLASEPTRDALHRRLVAGVLYAAARFVPVPIVDDLVRERIARWMVAGIVPASMPQDATRDLWADRSGCMPGCLGWLARLPITLLLFPIRKVLAVVLGVRWVARDLAEMLLLGRVIDHALASGLLSESRSREELAVQSLEVRQAFDAAMRGTDTSLLVALLSTALGPIRALVAAAVRTLRTLRRTRAEEPAPEGADRQVIEESVGRVESMLAQPEAKKFLAAFDARVVENLDVLARRRAERALARAQST
jgi:hypothetical protein